MELKINNILIATIHWNGKINFSDNLIVRSRQCGKNTYITNIYWALLYHSLKKKEYIKNCRGVNRKYRRLNNVRYK